MINVGDTLQCIDDHFMGGLIRGERYKVLGTLDTLRHATEGAVDFKGGPWCRVHSKHTRNFWYSCKRFALVSSDHNASLAKHLDLT